MIFRPAFFRVIGAKFVGSHLDNRCGVGDRFLAEIRNAARLHHPNIVTAYSALRIGESLVLVRFRTQPGVTRVAFGRMVNSVSLASRGIPASLETPLGGE